MSSHINVEAACDHIVDLLTEKGADFVVEERTTTSAAITIGARFLISISADLCGVWDWSIGYDGDTANDFDHGIAEQGMDREDSGRSNIRVLGVPDTVSWVKALPQGG